ncbi:MAG: gliding motility-associated C-terminal domain-containing protein [Bacteroidota bacterium]
MKQAGKWFFGVYAGVNFTGTSTLPETSQPNAFMTPISPGIISDSAGNILFMATPKQIYNKNFELAGDGMFGHYSCTQPVIILPKPDDPSRYFVFTSDSYRNLNEDKGLNYTVLTVDTYTGIGGANTLNINLIPDKMDGRLTAVKHANGKDYWLISHRWESNEFCTFRVTAGGVDANYVSSSVGTMHAGANNLLGFMKASPDGSRLAVALYESGIVEVFNFNNETGSVTTAKTSPADYYGAYGLEFSPDNSKLYISTLDYSNIIPAFPSELYQFDLNASDIFGSATSVHTSEDAFRYAGLQLGIDGRIYLAKSINAMEHSDSLGVIYNPNRTGLACNYNSLNGADRAFYLGGRQSFWGLPNVVQSYVDWPHFTYDSVCVGDVSIFRVNNQTNIDDASWAFSDPAGSSNTADPLNPTHAFSNDGQYTVSVTETYNGIDYTYSESVVVHPLPQVSFGVDTIYIFKGDYAVLSVGQWAGYLWSTGSTSSEIAVSEPGKYWVRVRNEKCCYNYDSVYVVQYELHVPNAFRPSSTLNNEFKPIVPFNAVQDYRLLIYDRWGKLVFESREIGTGWTGEINGQEAPFGVYAWRIDYQTVSDDGTRPIQMAGTVMLLK